MVMLKSLNLNLLSFVKHDHMLLLFRIESVCLCSFVSTFIFDMCICTTVSIIFFEETSISIRCI